MIHNGSSSLQLLEFHVPMFQPVQCQPDVFIKTKQGSLQLKNQDSARSKAQKKVTCYDNTSDQPGLVYLLLYINTYVTNHQAYEPGRIIF
ncbi:hypothetical protein L5515_011636 [Caenorhabditis briggsae]|uniref:Uncharacterized protein n=1 Tax=Caenorhabditis briggsae TaxID=6238 RepID=A0AAE9EUU8_CAEBR|nr:hypothetical protein L5515_011636 [Caenorhabditis briggsae]